MKEKDYPAVIYPADECGFGAAILELPGCIAQGDPLIECLNELKTVKEQWIESARRHERII